MTFNLSHRVEFIKIPSILLYQLLYYINICNNNKTKTLLIDINVISESYQICFTIRPLLLSKSIPV